MSEVKYGKLTSILWFPSDLLSATKFPRDLISSRPIFPDQFSPRPSFRQRVHQMASILKVLPEAIVHAAIL